MEQSLVISFANKQEVSDSYWLRMELVEEDTQMTIGEAATLIDELYHTSICGEEWEPLPEPEDGSEAKPSGTDWTTALQMLNLPTCDAYNQLAEGNPGGYEADIKVYRSHQRELYKLILSNGYAGSPRRMEERVELTLTVDGQSSIALDTPIVARPRIAWTDIDGPDINIKGNTLWWEGNVTGTIRAEFDTVYDLVHIRVTGTQTGQTVIEGTGDPQWLGAGWYSGSETGEELTEVQDIQCSVLAFYHYQYEELVLNRPEMDESVDNDLSQAVCMQQGSTTVVDGDDPFDPDEYRSEAACKEACARAHPAGSQALADCQKDCERICYKTVRYTTICDCGGKESTQDIDVPVNCPDGYTTGSRINAGDTYDGGVTYVNCSNDGDVHQPWFYEQECCHGWPFGNNPPMPKCVVHYGPFTNKPTERDKIAEIKAAYGEDANIISVGPKEGRCGDTITEQKVNSLNCCDGISDMAWDEDYSSENMPGMLGFTGGKPPFTWTLDGGGFTFTNGQQEIITDGRRLSIYVDEPCPSGTLRVADVCNHQLQKNLQSETQSTLEYDSENSGDTMSGNSYITIRVKGGQGPTYYWEIEGDGFWLDRGHTKKTSTTGQGYCGDIDDYCAGHLIFTDSMACGSCTITITDSCGDEVEGSAVTTNGEWAQIESCWAGPGSAHANTCYEGKYKHFENWCGDNCETCELEHCGNLQANCPPYSSNCSTIEGRTTWEWVCPT